MVLLGVLSFGYSTIPALCPALDPGCGAWTSAAELEDVPVGAVILDEASTVIARARNRREVDHDPTAHAEIVAIRQAAHALGSWRPCYATSSPPEGRTAPHHGAVVNVIDWHRAGRPGGP